MLYLYVGTPAEQNSAIQMNKPGLCGCEVVISIALACLFGQLIALYLFMSIRPYSQGNCMDFAYAKSTRIVLSVFLSAAVVV